ncbi:hypothetical protein HMPREF1544_00810 [Mucor circinelloides 1006PhL]|uniref:Uncharacterized protein n=1 Tax=Mucor circinelloides f. circinelloides (strain 1006PhL) TaxID=1220926 RepID=S2JPH5_MUCC1|nr:hypothetical protein HMPREF1544_00810 [Mucor circinelloides 1006PhL]
MVDWVDLSNTTKRHKAFCTVEQHQNDLFVSASSQHVQESSSRQLLEDPFLKESEYISPLVLRENIKTWKSTASRIEKLHLQDLLYYHILDFVSKSKNGTQEVYGAYYKAEYEKLATGRKANDEIRSLTRVLLNLKGKSLRLSLKDSLILAKQKNEYTNDASKIIRKICKVYVDLEEEKIRLYNIDTNEATYLLCFVRPIFVQLLMPISTMKFIWCESYLVCKKAEENRILMDQDEKAANTAKIDGILIQEQYNLEVALIEVSGPNYKVNSTHFYEDRKKLAKNLKSIYKAIMHSKDYVCAVSRREFKVYGFHFYLNKLYIYSLSQTADGHYVFSLASSFEIPHSKVVIHALPSFLANLWIVREILQDLNKSLVSLLTENEPSSQSSNESDEDHYVSPTKKQKTSSSKLVFG